MVSHKLLLHLCLILITTFIFVTFSLPITLWASVELGKILTFTQSDFAYRNSRSNLFSLSSDNNSPRSNHLLVSKSKSTALRWSLGATLVAPVIGGSFLLKGISGSEIKAGAVVGIVVGSLGLVFGPSTGHFYAHEYGRAWTGIGLRTLSGVIIMAGAVSIAMSDFNLNLFGSSNYDSGNSGASGGIGLIILGGGICLFSAIYDIATVGKSVEKYNSKHGLANFQITPIYFSQEKSVGLSLRLRF